MIGVRNFYREIVSGWYRKRTIKVRLDSVIHAVSLSKLCQPVMTVVFYVPCRCILNIHRFEIINAQKDVNASAYNIKFTLGCGIAAQRCKFQSGYFDSCYRIIHSSEVQTLILNIFLLFKRIVFRLVTVFI